MLRLDPTLHGALKKAALSHGLSLNEYCQEALRASLRVEDRRLEQGPPFVDALRKEFGAALLGVVLFGSAARNELTERSDIDLLVVLQTPPAREHYRRWDSSDQIHEAMAGYGLPVNPQFVQLPERSESAGGIWLEAAIEGRVLWDPELKIHSTLVTLRRAISDGRFERAVSHGHPYWIRKEAG